MSDVLSSPNSDAAQQAEDVLEMKKGSNKPKKQTPNITAAEIDALAKTTGDMLNEQDKVTIVIPLLTRDRNKPDPNDKVPIPVCVNGYQYRIMRGQKVQVPQTVSDILEESGYLGYFPD